MIAKRVLVIEDEAHMLVGLRDNLEFEGYDVITASSGEEGLLKARSMAADLVLLDITLPQKSGFDVCRELRASNITTPIVMLTARGQEMDKMRGFELGADDYVTKPFSIMELLARLKAVLRRAHGFATANLETCHIGDMVVNFRLQSAERRGRRVDFTALELDLLRFFVTHAGQVVTRDQIFSEVWGGISAQSTRTIDNFVARLRHKIESTPHDPKHIVTIHGSGYKFVG